MEGLDYRDAFTDIDLPADRFFDCATIHLLSTATFGRLRRFVPPGRFEVRHSLRTSP